MQLREPQVESHRQHAFPERREGLGVVRRGQGEPGLSGAPCAVRRGRRGARGSHQGGGSRGHAERGGAAARRLPAVQETPAPAERLGTPLNSCFSETLLETANPNNYHVYQLTYIRNRSKLFLVNINRT